MTRLINKLTCMLKFHHAAHTESLTKSSMVISERLASWGGMPPEDKTVFEIYSNRGGWIALVTLVMLT